MKQSFLILTLTLLTSFAFSQKKESVYNLQFVSATDLASCTDASAFDGDLITTVGIVIHDGGLTELASSSLGYRPGVHIIDTADGGKLGPFKGLQIHGVHDGNTQITKLDELLAGNIVSITGTLGTFAGETQLYPRSNSDVVVIGNVSAPTPLDVSVGDLNDDNRSNQLETGEQYEGLFVKIKNVTVTNVNLFTASGKNRVSFDVTDKDGNTMNIGDRFLAQKLTGYQTDNSQSPSANGSFVAPVVGTVFESISGIILHSENGCTGGTGRGYEMNPFSSDHYKIGDTPPSFTNTTRTPLVPKGSEAVEINSDIVDFNGTVSSAKLYYALNETTPVSDFDSVDLVLMTGSTETYEATIPGAANGTLVRYYMGATDNDGNLSLSPFNARNATNPNLLYYTVRDNGLTIVDIQKVINVNNDASPYRNQEVTVTGIVTASARNYDLGYIYIQDETATEWAAIECVGNSDLLNLYRTQKVTITGTVNEFFGFTQIDVSSVVNTGEVGTVTPVDVDPSNAAFFDDREIEKYEGMLVQYKNPSGKVFISNPRINNFGEFMVGNTSDAAFAASQRVQAGIQNGNNSSSLWVSVVSDDSLSFQEGEMEVTEIEATQGMSMDGLVGIMYYGFGEYKLKPRNNDDYVNFSETLEATDYPDIPASVQTVNAESIGAKVYPNPSNGEVVFGLTSKNNFKANVYSLEGRLIASFEGNGFISSDLTALEAGMYLVEMIDVDADLSATLRWIKQ